MPRGGRYDPPAAESHATIAIHAHRIGSDEHVVNVVGKETRGRRRLRDGRRFDLWIADGRRAMAILPCGRTVRFVVTDYDPLMYTVVEEVAGMRSSARVLGTDDLRLGYPAMLASGRECIAVIDGGTPKRLVAIDTKTGAVANAAYDGKCPQTVGYRRSDRALVVVYVNDDSPGGPCFIRSHVFDPATATLLADPVTDHKLLLSANARVGCVLPGSGLVVVVDVDGAVGVWRSEDGTNIATVRGAPEGDIDAWPCGATSFALGNIDGPIAVYTVSDTITRTYEANKPTTHCIAAAGGVVMFVPANAPDRATFVRADTGEVIAGWVPLPANGLEYAGTLAAFVPTEAQF